MNENPGAVNSFAADCFSPLGLAAFFGQRGNRAAAERSSAPFENPYEYQCQSLAREQQYVTRATHRCVRLIAYITRLLTGVSYSTAVHLLTQIFGNYYFRISWLCGSSIWHTTGIACTASNIARS